MTEIPTMFPKKDIHDKLKNSESIVMYYINEGRKEEVVVVVTKWTMEIINICGWFHTRPMDQMAIQKPIPSLQVCETKVLAVMSEI